MQFLCWKSAFFCMLMMSCPVHVSMSNSHPGCINIISCILQQEKKNGRIFVVVVFMYSIFVIIFTKRTIYPVQQKLSETQKIWWKVEAGRMLINAEHIVIHIKSVVIFLFVCNLRNYLMDFSFGYSGICFVQWYLLAWSQP